MKRVLSSVIATVLVLASCARDPQKVQPSVVALSPNTEFATALLEHATLSSRGNAVLCPHGISHTLALLAKGASGATRSELESALHLSPDAKPVFSRAADWSSRTRAWASADVVIKSAFAHVAEDKYQCSLGSGFDPAKMRAWAAQDLERPIDGLVDWSAMPSEGLVVVNVSRFVGTWLETFETSATATEPFRRATGDTVSVAMMSAKPHCGYLETEAWQIVCLSYTDADVCAVIMLPKTEELPLAVLARTGASPIEEALARSSGRSVDLHLPRFDFEAFVDVRDAVVGTGVRRAWIEREAEFDGMSDTRLWIGSIVQSVRIQVDEVGTTAEAITVLRGLGYASADDMPAVRVDHPFLFLVAHRPARTILFAAVVGDPTETSVGSRQSD